MTGSPMPTRAFPGRVNQADVPELRPGDRAERLLENPAWRAKYWFPDTQNAHTPQIDRFWREMIQGVTEFRHVTLRDPPLEDAGASPMVIVNSPRLAHPPAWSGRMTRSPNWAGTSVRSVGSTTFTEIVGSWVEPAVQAVGQHKPGDRFRSSIWLGFNGHARHKDAALPQLGSMQRIPIAGDPDTRTHWLWFEWWANEETNFPVVKHLPVYLDLDLTDGDRVYASVELIAGSLDDGDPPIVARMCICVDHPQGGPGAPATKVMLLPFLVHPPVLDEGKVEPTGSAGNWIVELPASRGSMAPFLMPRFRRNLEFSHCALGAAFSAGGPIVRERGLAVSRRIDMFGVRHESAAQGVPMPFELDGVVDTLASVQRERPHDHEFAIAVHGNGP